MLDALREQVWKLHLELPKNDLVRWTGGNVSGRDPATGKKGMWTLEKMMISQPILQPFRRLVQNPNGIIFVTGPTGSGKTLAAFLASLDELFREGLDVRPGLLFRVEPQVVQVPVDNQKRFAEALASRGQAGVCVKMSVICGGWK